MTAALETVEGVTMISTWSEWKRYPGRRSENIEAPISPGLYEVRFAASGALHSFGRSTMSPSPVDATGGVKIMVRAARTAELPDLEYRTCATSSKADAKDAAERMIGRRETYMSGAA